MEKIAATDFTDESKVKELFKYLLKEAIVKAQAKIDNKDGVFILEAYQTIEKELMELKKILPYVILMIDSQIIDYYQKSELYYNSDFTKFSFVPLEGYKTWAQQSTEDFKGYEFDEENKIVRKKDMKAFKFSEQI